jgi:hypothetical protein
MAVKTSQGNGTRKPSLTHGFRGKKPPEESLNTSSSEDYVKRKDHSNKSRI